MADEKNMIPEEEMEEVEVYTLTDEEGNESQFELIGEAEIDGVTYYALTELDEEGNLRVEGTREEAASSAGHSRVFSVQILF